jgi:hypothetical protein
MVRRTAFVLIVGACVALPSVAAADEENPHVADEAKNVRYHELYQGPHDHDYLDFTAAWFWYSNATDELVLTLKGPDFSRLAEPLDDDFNMRCWLATNIRLYGDEGVQQITYRFQNYYRGQPFRSYVNISHTPDPPTVIKHTLETTFSSPGYIHFRVEREALLKLGEFLEDLQAYCGEDYSPGGTVDPTFPVAGIIRLFGEAPIENHNPQRQGGFSLNLSSLVPTANSEADDEVQLSPQNESAPLGADSPSVGPLGPMGALIAMALVFNRRLRD